ncbi:Ubiquitin-conjugating enzyme E2 6 [Arthrobotrys musiformis]|uniref:Ubiquitin-conjugating enzyme E2 6 n=1 Tax=Arthrobotrys musiformis TaxID=47236 RepID=A0AAV9VWB7_9PEZI
MPRPQPKRKRTEASQAPDSGPEQTIVVSAPPAKKARLRNPEIVIGVDWGTTWTGVAWTLVTEKPQSEDVRVNMIQKWASGKGTSDKVPTEFMYTEEGTWETMKWGFQTQSLDLSPKVIRWTKLLLDPDYTTLVPEAQEAAEKIPHNKEVVDLVADYLSALRAHIIEKLTETYGPTFFNRLKLKYILTVPAIWSEKAKETHLEAAAKAGYGSKEELDLISEPQAAAIAAFRSLGHGPLRRYDCFTVVDCGGGTVDLISYKIMNFRPQLEFREITAGQGGYERMPQWSKAKMMASFELEKQSFSDDDDQEECSVSVGAGSTLPRKYKGAVGIDETGEIVLSREDMRNIFDPTIDSIISLISGQIKSAAEAAKTGRAPQRVKMILLVGGFGGSPYLRRRVQEWIKEEKHNIEVVQPPDAWTAIARGAVMHGVENQIVKDRVARTSYGVCVDVRFKEGVHPRNHVDNYHDEYDGILRGVRINGTKSVFRVTYCQHLETAEFADSGNLKISDTLYAYNGDDTPSKPSDSGVRPLCDLRTDLSSIPSHKWKVKNKTDGTSYYLIEFDFVMEVEGEKLLFGLEIDGVSPYRMASKTAYKRLTKEYKHIQEEPPPYITAHPLETNILEWVYLIDGPPDTPYTGGQYWGTLVFPPDYPFKPPAIRMMTPSGRFQTSTRLCLSISDFHPKSFNPAWEVSTILTGLLSFMTSEEMTTGSISATLAQRKQLAAMSRWWNSTGGGTSTGGGGKIGFGDGGARFRTDWPEVDRDNWQWMRDHKINPQNGRVLSASTPLPAKSEGSEIQEKQVAGRLEVVERASQSWLSRNKIMIATAIIVAWVAIGRVFQHDVMAS